MELHAGEYAYVLGVYLGGGWLSQQPGTWLLRITLDNDHPGVIEEVTRATAAVSPTGRAGAYRSPRSGHSIVWSSSKLWPCLLPQYEPGKKHHRRIVLADWQQQLVDEAPGRLLRGLIHSDGWRGTNRVRVKGRDYEYPRYQFSSRSDDIRRIFTDTCDLLGIAWRPWGRWHISVARREAVARLDEHVGPKR